jgi:hypothetical protein
VTRRYSSNPKSEWNVSFRQETHTRRVQSEDDASFWQVILDSPIKLENMFIPEASIHERRWITQNNEESMNSIVNLLELFILQELRHKFGKERMDASHLDVTHHIRT